MVLTAVIFDTMVTWSLTVKTITLSLAANMVFFGWITVFAVNV